MMFEVAMSKKLRDLRLYSRRSLCVSLPPSGVLPVSAFIMPSEKFSCARFVLSREVRNAG